MFVCLFLPQVWLEVCQAAFDVMLDGFCKIKKVSSEGRAAMTMDVFALHEGLNSVHLCRPPRGKHHIDSYLRMSYMNEEGIMEWVVENYNSYAYRHIYGLLVQTIGASSSMLNNSKKFKEAVATLDELYGVESLNEAAVNTVNESLANLYFGYTSNTSNAAVTAPTPESPSAHHHHGGSSSDLHHTAAASPAMSTAAHHPMSGSPAMNAAPTSGGTANNASSSSAAARASATMHNMANTAKAITQFSKMTNFARRGSAFGADVASPEGGGGAHRSSSSDHHTSNDAPTSGSGGKTNGVATGGGGREQQQDNKLSNMFAKGLRGRVDPGGGKNNNSK